MLMGNILYVLATGSLMVGSVLDFKQDDLSSYFFVIGSSLFFIKSLLSFCSYMFTSKQKELAEIVYDDIFQK